MAEQSGALVGDCSMCCISAFGQRLTYTLKGTIMCNRNAPYYCIVTMQNSTVCNYNDSLHCNRNIAA